MRLWNYRLKEIWASIVKLFLKSLRFNQALEVIALVLLHLLVTRRGTLLMETRLLHDYFGNFSMQGERHYFTWGEIEPMWDEIEMNIAKLGNSEKLKGQGKGQMGSRHLGQDGWGGAGIPDIGGVPDMGGVADMGWSSRHGWGSRHEMGFQTWGGIPDTGRVPDMGNLSFSEFSNVCFNLTSRGFNFTSRKIISFTSHGNLTSHQSGILHSLIFLIIMVCVVLIIFE